MATIYSNRSISIGTKNVTVDEVLLNSTDFIDLVWSDSVKSLVNWKSTAPAKSGYTCIGAVNGGAFSSAKPYGSFQINGVEKATIQHYGDPTIDLGIKSGRMYADWIGGKNDPSGYNLLRHSFAFSFEDRGNGLEVQHEGNTGWAGTEHAEYKASAKRTAIAWKSNGNCYIIVVKTLITGSEFLTLCKNMAFSKVVNLDGGNSTGMMISNGTGTASSAPGRNIHEIMYVYEKNATNPDPGESNPIPGLYLSATKLSFRVRSSVVSGSQLALVPVGGRAEIISFLGIQTDGYQWAKVKYNGIVGYSQIDTYNAYTVTGTTTNRYLNATKQSFRVRNAPVGGTSLTIVPVGGRAQITLFGAIQTDGYQWVGVNYNGITGYSQIDTKNCYTIS